jgi:hypothetical protein
MTGVGRDVEGHGFIQTFYMQEQLESLWCQVLEEMENLTIGMMDGNADDEGESVASLSRATSFGPNRNLGSTAFRDSSRTPAATQLIDELVKTTYPHKRKTKELNFWYQLVNVAGGR